MDVAPIFLLFRCVESKSFAASLLLIATDARSVGEGSPTDLNVE
ncbi:hypothetical protein RMSM_00435 [Rhodopirellula maiorica SM1]|uniref:Uncharacterized protein n=1 Tax=Rhodopirellula maiorica SM1 TaxID=1265738 RepID=M5RTI5_9BACT|nr:hypothetical protein RMSM_00435 [Rhodopirellula maiorica SM1]